PAALLPGRPRPDPLHPARQLPALGGGAPGPRRAQPRSRQAGRRTAIREGGAEARGRTARGRARDHREPDMSVTVTDSAPNPVTAPVRWSRSRFAAVSGGLAIFSLVVLFFLYFFDEFDTAAFATLAPEIQKAFHLTDNAFATVRLLQARGPASRVRAPPERATTGRHRRALRRGRGRIDRRLAAGVHDPDRPDPDHGVLRHPVEEPRARRHRGRELGHRGRPGEAGALRPWCAHAVRRAHAAPPVRGVVVHRRGVPAARLPDPALLPA